MYYQIILLIVLQLGISFGNDIERVDKRLSGIEGRLSTLEQRTSELEQFFKLVIPDLSINNPESSGSRLSLIQSQTALFNLFTNIREEVRNVTRVQEDLIQNTTEALEGVKDIASHLKLVLLKGDFDCCDLRKQGFGESGIYIVRINSNLVRVWCDMITDGGGWTVMHHRTLQGPKIDFYRNWTEYENGFGTPPFSYWLGLLNIYELTKNGNQLVKINIESFNSSIGKSVAEYNGFSLGGPSEKFKLQIGTYSGTAGDAMGSVTQGVSFSTYDNDNDGWATGNCAKDRHGSWWYSGCNAFNPNGILYSKETAAWDAVFWHGLNPIRSLKSMQIAIRNKNPGHCGQMNGSKLDRAQN